MLSFHTFAETDNGSNFMALGWAGTWSASFRYEDEGARFIARELTTLYISKTR